MNELLLLLEIVVAFVAVVLLKAMFGKVGLTAWACVATVLANIMTAKSVNIMGVGTTLGTVLFASTFLVTDILTECYGERAAKDAVKLAVVSAVAFIVASQIALAYHANEIDYANGAMSELFGLNLRISVASVVMFFAANYIDVLLYGRLKKASGGRRMWVRNNVCTIVCNGVENFAFIALAFAGIYSFTDILVIAASTTVIEILVAICDTPFLYWAVRGGGNERTEFGVRRGGA